MMKSFRLTRSVATDVVIGGWALALALAALVPFGAIRGGVAFYFALLMVGLTMLLRERVLVRVEVAEAGTTTTTRTDIVMSAAG
jgi:hypothetical protein